MSYLRDLLRRMLPDLMSHKYKKPSQRQPLMQETFRQVAVSMSLQTSPMSTVGSRRIIKTSIITLARSLTRLELDLVTKSTTTHRLVTDMKNTMDHHRELPRSVINNRSWVMRLITDQPPIPALQPTADNWKRRTKTSNREVSKIRCLAVAKKIISKERVRRALHASLNIHRKSLRKHTSQPSWALKASMIRLSPPIAACSRIAQT